MLRTEAPPITPRDVMRMCLHSRRVALRNGWWTPSSRMKIDSGDDYHRRKWTPQYETAWQELTDEKRGLLAEWRANLFRD